MRSDHDIPEPEAGGQGLLLQEAEGFILQHGEESPEGQAGKLAPIAALAEPAALRRLQVQIPGEFGAVGAVVHQQRPALFSRPGHEAQRQLPAPDGGYVALAAEVQVFPGVIADVVFVQVQLGAVDEIRAGIEDLLFLAQEGVVDLFMDVIAAQAGAVLSAVIELPEAQDADGEAPDDEAPEDEEPGEDAYGIG